MLRRFAGFHGRAEAPRLELPQLSVNILVPSPRGLIVDNLGMDTPNIKRLANLLAQAEEFRKPPEYIIEMLDEAFCDVELDIGDRINKIIDLEFR